MDKTTEYGTPVDKTSEAEAKEMGGIMEEVTESRTQLSLDNNALPSSSSSPPPSLPSSSKSLVSTTNTSDIKASHISYGNPVSPQPCSSSSVDPEDSLGSDNSVSETGTRLSGSQADSSLVNFSNAEVSSSTEEQPEETVKSFMNSEKLSGDQTAVSSSSGMRPSTSYSTSSSGAGQRANEVMGPSIRSQGGDIYEKVVKSAEAVMALLSRLFDNKQS